METTNSWVQSSDWTNYVQLPASLDYTSIIAPRVLNAQEIDLREAVGNDFYRALAAVLNNSGNVSGATVDGVAVSMTQAAYDAITPYLKPVIILYAYARHRELFDIKETRFGARVKDDPHSKPASDKAVDRTIHRTKSDASHYLKRLKDFLEDNANNYQDFVRISRSKSKGTPQITSLWEDDDLGYDWTSYPHGKHV